MHQTLFSWVPVGELRVDFGLQLDQLSICFVLLITGVGSLIHVYSIGYMAHDPERRRFFAYLNLFVAAMLLLVLADNYLGLYVGWEGVGLASYLLIGFWSHKPSAATAAKKAFVVNRVGDIGLALALMVMFAHFGTVSYAGVFAPPGSCAGYAQRHRAAAAARRVRQVRAGAAAVLARRRDGGSDAGLRADPRRDDGHRGRLPDRAVRAGVRPRARRPARRRRRRRGHAAVRRDHRLRQGRHQEGARRIDDEPDRLHGAGRRVSAPPATRSRSCTCSPTASSRPGCSSAPAR